MNKYLKKARDKLLSTVAYKLNKGLALEFYKRLSRRFGIELVTAPGRAGLITGTPYELVMGSYLYNQDYSPELVELICKKLLRNKTGTFIDIGANIGLITVPVARDSQAVVHSFEPEPRNFRCLSVNVNANLPKDRVHLYNVALASKAGTLEFELSNDNFGDHRLRGESLISQEKFGEGSRQVIEVVGEKLDTLLDGGSLPHPIVVKLDTQGAECEVVKGGSRLFSVADYVIAEYCPYMILRMGSKPSEFIEWSKGFPYGAVVDEKHGSLRPIDDVVRVMMEIPQDGSAARHIDILLARKQNLADGTE